MSLVLVCPWYFGGISNDPHAMKEIYWWGRFVSICTYWSRGCIEALKAEYGTNPGHSGSAYVHPLYSHVVYCYCIWGLINLDFAKFLNYCIHSTLYLFSFLQILPCILYSPRWSKILKCHFHNFCDFPNLIFQSLWDCPFKHLACVWVKSTFIVESK